MPRGASMLPTSQGLYVGPRSLSFGRRSRHEPNDMDAKRHGAAAGLESPPPVLAPLQALRLRADVTKRLLTPTPPLQLSLLAGSSNCMEPWGAGAHGGIRMVLILPDASTAAVRYRMQPFRCL